MRLHRLGCAEASVSNRFVVRLAGLISVLSPLLILLAAPFAARVRGFGGPGPIAFGDEQVLLQLNAMLPAAVWVDTMALIGPTLAFAIGIGWYLILRRTSAFALYGMVLWYVGLVFIVAQDALQLALVSKLPGAYVVANDSAQPAILVFGVTLAYTIEVLANVGIVSYVGAFILYLVTWRTASIPKWIGAVGTLSSGLAILSSLLVMVLPQIPALGIGRPIGLLANIVLGIALGIVMLRWKEIDTAVAA
jgi:hypothetical protein